MGLLNFSVTEYGQRAATIQSTQYATGGAYTTSTSASNVENAAGDIILQAGQVMFCYADEAMRIRFAGVAATATTGHYLPPSVPMWFECREGGLVSVIDVA